MAFAITSLTLTRFISKICLAINSIETIGWIAFFLDFFFLRGSGDGKCVYVHKTLPWFRPIHNCRHGMGFMPIIRFERMTY